MIATIIASILLSLGIMDHRPEVWQQVLNGNHVSARSLWTTTADCEGCWFTWRPEPWNGSIPEGWTVDVQPIWNNAGDCPDVPEGQSICPQDSQCHIWTRFVITPPPGDTTPYAIKREDGRIDPLDFTYGGYGFTENCGEGEVFTVQKPVGVAVFKFWAGCRSCTPKQLQAVRMR